MTTNYPSALDDGTILGSAYNDSTPTETEHAEQHNNLADAVIAVETELGVNPSGSFASVVARLADLVVQAPTASQTIQSTGDFISLAVKAHASQSVNMVETRSSGGALLGSIDAAGVIDAAGYQVGGSSLASANLSDAASLIKNPSPSITTPNISDGSMSGTTVAPTPSTSDNTTKIATTAYVIAQQYAKLANANFTGVPVAPTAAVDTNTTQIATTEFVINQIAATPATPVNPGLIMAYAGSSAPSGWLLCDGSSVAQATYPNLYTAIGTSYGGGAGNFNLPDLRGRALVGLGTHVDVDSLGDNDAVAVASRRPKHVHNASLGGASGGDHGHGVSVGSAGSHSHSISGGSGVSRLGGSSAYAVATGVGTSSVGDHTHSLGSIGAAGGHSHTVGGSIGASGLTDGPAYLVLNYIIKT